MPTGPTLLASLQQQQQQKIAIKFGTQNTNNF
jgi:hypothetical protein